MMGSTILCVDDDALVLEVTRIPLEHHGYRVLTAENAAAAVSLLQRADDDIALVLLDWGTPGAKNDDAVLKLNMLRPGIRILATSGYGSEFRPAPEVQAYVSGFLPKPYLPKDLIRAVRHALRPARRTAAA